LRSPPAGMFLSIALGRRIPKEIRRAVGRDKGL
jgi:hypothetical protein